MYNLSERQILTKTSHNYSYELIYQKENIIYIMNCNKQLNNLQVNIGSPYGGTPIPSYLIEPQSVMNNMIFLPGNTLASKHFLLNH